MTVSIKPIDPVNRAFFAGEVSGLDLRKPLSKDEVAAVHAGMDEFGVLVFHDQKIDDDQQLVFSRSLGPLEQATGDISAGPAGRAPSRRATGCSSRARAPARQGPPPP